MGWHTSAIRNRNLVNELFTCTGYGLWAPGNGVWVQARWSHLTPEKIFLINIISDYLLKENKDCYDDYFIQ